MIILVYPSFHCISSKVDIEKCARVCRHIGLWVSSSSHRCFCLLVDFLARLFFIKALHLHSFLLVRYKLHTEEHRLCLGFFSIGKQIINWSDWTEWLWISVKCFFFLTKTKIFEFRQKQLHFLEVLLKLNCLCSKSLWIDFLFDH